MGFDSYAKRSKQQVQPIMDIEELVTTMKEKTVGCWQKEDVVYLYCVADIFCAGCRCARFT